MTGAPRERGAPGASAARAGDGTAYDPGRERRAEQRARELLRSCVNEEEWAMYRDLGLIRVWGGDAPTRSCSGVPYAYLIYPHKPIVAYLPQTGRSCSASTASSSRTSPAPYGSARLPDSDDVLAKWMALKGDERRLISARQHAPARPPARPAPGPARPLAPRPLGAERLERRRRAAGRRRRGRAGA